MLFSSSTLCSTGGSAARAARPPSCMAVITLLRVSLPARTKLESRGPQRAVCAHAAHELQRCAGAPAAHACGLPAARLQRSCATALLGSSRARAQSRGPRRPLSSAAPQRALQVARVAPCSSPVLPCQHADKAQKKEKGKKAAWGRAPPAPAAGRAGTRGAAGCPPRSRACPGRPGRCGRSGRGSPRSPAPPAGTCTPRGWSAAARAPAGRSVSSAGRALQGGTLERSGKAACALRGPVICAGIRARRPEGALMTRKADRGAHQPCLLRTAGRAQVPARQSRCT